MAKRKYSDNIPNVFLNHFRREEESCCNNVLGITAQFVCVKQILDTHEELEQFLSHCLTLTLLPHPSQSKSNHLLVYGFQQDT